MTRPCPVTAGCRRLAGWIFRRPPGRPSDALTQVRLADRLNEAIRRGSETEVLDALRAGASPTACTYDYEGYHAPTELALRHGFKGVAEVIEQWQAPGESAAPPPP